MRALARGPVRRGSVCGAGNDVGARAGAVRGGSGGRCAADPCGRCAADPCGRCAADPCGGARTRRGAEFDVDHDYRGQRRTRAADCVEFDVSLGFGARDGGWAGMAGTLAVASRSPRRRANLGTSNSLRRTIEFDVDRDYRGQRRTRPARRRWPRRTAAWPRGRAARRSAARRAAARRAAHDERRARLPTRARSVQAFSVATAARSPRITGSSPAARRLVAQEPIERRPRHHHGRVRPLPLARRGDRDGRPVGDRDEPAPAATSWATLNACPFVQAGWMA